MADTMYDPVSNLRNCCKARDDGHGEDETMAMDKRILWSWRKTVR